MTTKSTVLDEHIIEIISDSGEGAQKAGTNLAIASAKMGNGVWNVEIIPSEIQPPARTKEGLSGNRIRIATKTLTNGGNYTNTCLAFNEIVLDARLDDDVFDPNGAMIFIDNKWANDPATAESYTQVIQRAKDAGHTVYEVPLEEETKKIIDNPRRGKNMFGLGILAYLYDRDLELIKKIIADQFKKKDPSITENNWKLLDAGVAYAREVVGKQYSIPATKTDVKKVVMNGNEALALGSVDAGLELCSMYPITPATSVSHYLATFYAKYGGIVHQAEDEIAAVGVAVGASFAGTPSFTVTSGPGLALKSEFIGLAIMAETPLVVMDIQRGGPSTGMPTKVEQSDLMIAVYGAHGDAPRIVVAPSCIEECFYIVKTARSIADSLRTVVVILSDGFLATGVQSFPKPNLSGLAKRADRTNTAPLENFLPYNWDPKTGISPRSVPGQKGGEYRATGLNHTTAGKVSYKAEDNQLAHEMRSKKLQTLYETLEPPKVFGDTEGDLLLIGWGSTRGVIEESVTNARSKGKKVSALHLRFLSPFEPGIQEIGQKFKKIIVVEMNYSDPAGTYPRRYGQLATMLRAHTLLDIDSCGRAFGQPYRPLDIEKVINEHC